MHIFEAKRKASPSPNSHTEGVPSSGAGHLFRGGRYQLERISQFLGNWRELRRESLILKGGRYFRVVRELGDGLAVRSVVLDEINLPYRRTYSKIVPRGTMNSV